MSKKEEKTREKENVILRVPKLLLEKLENEKEKRGYPSVQTIINEAIRERYFGENNIPGIYHKAYTGAKRGPKPKFNHVDMISDEPAIVWSEKDLEDNKVKNKK